MKAIDLLFGAIVFVVTTLFVLGVCLWVRIDREIPAPAPDFTCAQTVSPDSAAILSADLWDRAQRNERTRIFFECRDGITFYRLERVR